MIEPTPREQTDESPRATASVDALPELRTQTVRLANELPGVPRQIRVEAGETAVEVVWDTSSAPDAGAPPASGAAPVPTPAPETTTGYRITAPLVGTHYRAAGPGDPPFVEVGDVVAAGQQVAIVEAMKLMNPVEADRSGTVTAVLAQDGEMVEYGQPLVELDAGNEG
jgi:acetyl-CoA carboxylase biotin carboxyl carrier protein